MIFDQSLLDGFSAGFEPNMGLDRTAKNRIIELKIGFDRDLPELASPGTASKGPGLQDRLYDSLESGDMDGLYQCLYSLFSSIPYQNYANRIIQNYEGYYASVIYAYMASLGLPVVAEDTTNKGRVDMTIMLPDKVYVVEFKVDEPGKALDQIRDKGYHEKYLDGSREVFLLGIGFSSEEKNITEFEWERVRAEQ